MEYGIIFEGDTSPLAASVSEALTSLGLINGTKKALTDEVLTALNTYREANSLQVLDFCDPITLRCLGIDARGDELLSLAACAQSLGSCELEYYDAAANILRESRDLGITITEAAARYDTSFYHGEITESAMFAAVLAFINE